MSPLREADVFRRPRGKPEWALQKAIVIWLHAHGCLAVVTDAGAAYRAGAFSGDSLPRGWPDVTGLLPGGRFLGVECKAGRGRQNEAQKSMQYEIEQRGGLYILARSVEDIEAALETGKETP